VTNRDGSTTHNLANEYTLYYETFMNNPEDSLAWEEADINGNEVGVKVQAVI